MTDRHDEASVRRGTEPSRDQRSTARLTYGLGAYLLALIALQATAQHSYGALAPFIRADLGATSSQMGLIGSALYLGTASAAFLLGGWVDRRPAGRVVRLTGLGVAGSLVAIASAPLIPLVMLGYLLLGLSRGSILPTTDRVAFEFAPADARGFVFGLKQTGTPLGAISAALVLPPLAVTSIGWRGALLGTAVVIAVVVLVSGRVLAFVTGTTTGRPEAEPPPQASDRTAKSSAPMTNGPMALARRLTSPVVFSFGLGILQACAMTFLTLFLVDDVDLDAVTAARWFAIFGAGGAFGRIAVGWLSDRLFDGRRALLLLCSATLGGGLAITLGLAPGMVQVLPGGLPMAVFGFAVQGWVGIVRALGAELAGPGYSGRAGGLLLGSMMVGGLIGPPVFGFLADTTGSYGTGWVVMGSLALLTATSMVPAIRRESTERHNR